MRNIRQTNVHDVGLQKEIIMKKALYATVASLVLITSANADFSQYQESPETLVRFVLDQFRSDDVDINLFSHQRHESIYKGAYLRTVAIDNAMRERGGHCLHYHIEIGDYIYDPADIRGNIFTELVRKHDKSAIIRTTYYRDFPYNVDWYLEKHDELWYIVDLESEKYYGTFSKNCDEYEIILETDFKKVQESPESVIEYIYSYYVNALTYIDLSASRKVFKDGYLEALNRKDPFNNFNEYCWDSPMKIGGRPLNVDTIARTISYETDIKSEDTAVVTVTLYERDDPYIADWFLKQYDGAWYAVDLQDRATGELFSERCPPT